MWTNVVFLSEDGEVLAEHGNYDLNASTLDESTTVVYEMKQGLDRAMAQITALPQGESFHFVLNNTIVKDNRIPPRGFTNQGFESVQAQPVGVTYEDGQFWADQALEIPCGATLARVAVLHQTTSREYVEFLRDENTTDARGQIAYDLWKNHGSSAPVVMAAITVPLAPHLSADVDELSLNAGGVQTLCLSGGPGFAGGLYFVLGSFSGTKPGIPVDGQIVPLNLDFYLLYTLENANGPVLNSSLGFLDVKGQGGTKFAIPPGTNLPPGLRIDHAFVILDLATGRVRAASNAQSVTMAP